MSHLDTSPCICRLPESQAADLEAMRTKAAQFKARELAGPEFKAFRVPFGVYEQRKEGAYMLRVRFPAGGVLPHHMRALAEVSRKHGNGTLHVTTRQNIQVHSVPVDNIHPALTLLAEAGLSTKGGGGNTVRNVTACHDAGVCAEECFDVSPYAVALTEFLINDPLSFLLPRKYKIALSGCGGDCAGATVNDVGLIAKRKDDELGFAVYVGGGLGKNCRVADLFEEFVPADQIHLLAEAVKRVFDKHGNRKNRNRARLRYLIADIGLERFRELYAAEREELDQAGLDPLVTRELPCCVREPQPSAEDPAAGFETWREKNVEPQKQSPFYMVQLPLVLGDIQCDRLEELAQIVEDHGEGMVRTTQCQNLVLRWVHENELPAVHRKLAGLGLAETLPHALTSLTACTGASTCKLGVCLSRGLASALQDELMRADLDLDAFGDLAIKISGCPNSCGRHPVADIGLSGVARRRHGALVPHYVLQLGGRVGEGKTRLAERVQTIPARNVPKVVARLLHDYKESPEFPDYDAFLEARGRAVAAQLAEEFKDVPPMEEDAAFYCDWGSDEVFSLAGRDPGNAKRACST